MMKEKDDEKSPIFGTAIGDLGVVVIAALCTLTLFLILFQPSPFEKLEKAVFTHMSKLLVRIFRSAP